MAVALPIDIYEMLEARLGKEDAKAFVKAVESAIDDSSMRKKIEIEEKLTHELVTRELFEERMARMEDRIERRLAENRAEIIKWMFIFWCGQLGAIAAFLKFLR